MKRLIEPSEIMNDAGLDAVGLSRNIIASGISFVHKILDGLDGTLVDNGEARLAEMVELANLSAIIGNLLRTGIAKSSNGRFVPNGPHKYPDLLSTDSSIGDLEIKVALETNKPKGHLVKTGPHLICRYVLGQPDGSYSVGRQSRGDVVWLWEMRVGILEEHHFSVSNTAGDSGKTAVINSDGYNHLDLVYCSMPHFPAGRKTRSTYEALIAQLLGSLPPQGNLL